MGGSFGPGRRWGRRVGVLVAAVAVAGLLTSCLSVPPGRRFQSYVALGDSYTAGPVIPVQQTDPAGCQRSDHNYPHLVAGALTVETFADASCSGASTADMTSPQDVMPGPNPPQFDRLQQTTQLVTLGIGGNDIGFTEILKNCATLDPFGHPCQDHYVVNGDDQLAERIAATAPKLAAVLQGIHTRSPASKVFVVAYLDILPLTGNGCWPQMPFAYADVPYLRATEVELNTMIANEAAANDATYVDAYTASIGHDACQLPDARWVEPIVPVAPAAPVHPNLAGMQGTADSILGAVRAH
jgi:lysophospholipase L1-like esterase